MASLVAGNVPRSLRSFEVREGDHRAREDHHPVGKRGVACPRR